MAAYFSRCNRWFSYLQSVICRIALFKSSWWRGPHERNSPSSIGLVEVYNFQNA
jgi:hypothetical protein